MKHYCMGEKKLQGVAGKENGIIIEPTDKNSDLKQKSPKGDLYKFPDAKRRKKLWTGRAGFKTICRKKQQIRK